MVILILIFIFILLLIIAIIVIIVIVTMFFIISYETFAPPPEFFDHELRPKYFCICICLQVFILYQCNHGKSPVREETLLQFCLLTFYTPCLHSQ